MDLIINKLPSITWSWLKMNQANVDLSTEGEQGVLADIPPEVTYEARGVQEFARLLSGMGTQMDDYVRETGVVLHQYRIGENTQAQEPLRLRFFYEDGVRAANALEFHVAPGASLRVIMDYSQKDGASGTGLVSVKAFLGEGASLDLVQVQRLNEHFHFFNDVAARCEKNAFCHLSQIILGGDRVYQGAGVDLAGEKSHFQTDIAYLVQGTSRLDMNYIARHLGKETVSRLNVRGVLRDEAYKLFRGTIDIERGAENSSGKENEEVLILDDGVVNKSIPIILCGEEDVEGAHGATIGRLDEELIFYMQSRGISEKECYELMAKARIREVCGIIGDEATTRAVECFIGGGEEDHA